MHYLEVITTIMMILELLVFVMLVVIFSWIFKILKKAKKITDDTERKIENLSKMKDKLSNLFFK